MHEYLDRVALAPPITDYYRALDIVELYQCWTTGVTDSKVLRFLHFYLILVNLEIMEGRSRLIK